MIDVWLWFIWIIIGADPVNFNLPSLGAQIEAQRSQQRDVVSATRTGASRLTR